MDKHLGIGKRIMESVAAALPNPVPITSWDQAISAAEQSIAKWQKKIEGLRFAVKVFKENKRDRVKW